jgi:competence protein ComEA
LAPRLGVLARRGGERVRRFLAGARFVPIGVVVICLLMVLSGAQVAQLYRTARAAGWWVYHDPVTFTGPGLDGATTTLQAFVLGAVEQPGAYVLPIGARVADLLAAAGGLLPAADTAALNESAALTQGQRVYVPYSGQAPASTAASLVNINAASADELRASLGITSATAENIVAYRDRHGAYTALSQLLLVPVTRATLDRIKYLITL